MFGIITFAPTFNAFSLPILSKLPRAVVAGKSDFGKIKLGEIYLKQNNFDLGARLIKDGWVKAKLSKEDLKYLLRSWQSEAIPNIVIDATDFFGDSTATDPSAQFSGVNGLASTKTYVQWVLVMDGALDADTALRTGDAQAYWYRGTGYITSIAPTVSPDSPVWVSPMEIAVTGSLTTGRVTG